jgi:hypothetical protein
MKCSSCSHDVRPVVALDIDGTLADWHSHFLQFGEQYLGRKLPNTFNGSNELSDELGLDKRVYHDMKLAFRAGGFKRWMPAFSGLKRLSHCLLRSGAEVWITTTRPWMRMDSVDPDTRHWLDRNNVLYHGLLYDENKYEILCDRVDSIRVVGVLEDQSEYFDEAKSLDLPVIHRRTRWNSAILREPYAATLYEAEALLSERVENWYSKHGQ